MKFFYPLMWSQQQCWIIEQLYPESSVNIIGGICIINGKIDIARLHNAMQSAIRHFDALRMQFVQADGQISSQILPFEPRTFRHITFSEPIIAQQAYPAEFANFQRKLFAQPFILRENDLFELISFSCGEQQGGYFVKAHHAIVDGWSMSLLTDHLKWAYEHPNQQWTDPLPPSYPRFLAQQQDYQNSARFIADRQWWKNYINEYIDCFPEKKPITETNGIACTTWLAHDMIDRIYRLCDRYSCSLNLLFVALFALYRARVWGEEKGVIGLPLFNRFSREAKRCFGMFTNHMPLAYRLNSNLTFAELTMRIKTAMESGFKHSKYPSILFNQDLAKYGGNHLRAFDYCVNFYNFTYERDFMGNSQHIEACYSNQQSYKLQLVLQTVNSHKESLKLAIEALDSEFELRQLQALQTGLLDLIIAIDAQPEANLIDLCVYPKPSTQLNHAIDRPLFNDLFNAQVNQQPERTAINDNAVSLSYRQLADKATCMAQKLSLQGIGRGSVVGILAERCASTVIAILGIVQCGAAFLPLNPELPIDRLRLLCQKSQVAHILYDKGSCELVSMLDHPASLLSDLGDSIGNALPFLPIVVNGDDLAYILFTSGSTGEPKGVQVTHANLANYLDFAIKQYFNANDQVPLYSSLSFDLTITSLFAPLSVGACINICRQAESEALLHRAVIEQPNTFIKLTPAHLRLLCVAGIQSQHMRTVVVGGEDFKLELAHKAAKLFPNATIYNEYGPTEATVGCMIYRYTGEENLVSVPIGRAIDGCQIVLCSPWGCLVPEGESGEIVIYGASVTQGYIGAPQQTAVAFLFDQSNHVIGYRSGDIGYALNADTLVYLGRSDGQIKINGYRIEQSEIEQALLSAPQVTAQAVAVVNDAKGNPSTLLAWVTPETVNTQLVMQYLRKKLPTYMLPQQCIAIPVLPLSINGKVDIQQLTQHAAKISSLMELQDKPQSHDKVIWHNVRDIVGKVLEQQHFTDSDNLYLLGLDSIKSIQIAAELRKRGWSIPGVQVMECSTVQRIGEYIISHYDPSTNTHTELSNEVNLPAVHWFNRLALSNRNFYNHLIVLDICLPLSVAELEQRLLAIIAQQPVLRSRFNEDGLLTILDCQTCYPNGLLMQMSEAQLTLDEVIHQINQTIDVEKGKLFAATYLTTNNQQNDKLILCAHHLAVDIHSWYLILSALDMAFNVVEQPYNQGLQKWSRYLATKHVSSEIQYYWQTQDQTEPLLFPAVTDANPAKPYTRIWRDEFRHTCVGRLLLNNRDNAMREGEARLLTALVPVLAHYSKQSHCRIDMEGVGRGCWSDEPDITDTVGWFTAFYPCVIPLTNDFAVLLPDIRQQLIQCPNNGGDYGVLHMQQQLTSSLQSGIRLNYIGREFNPPLTHFKIDHQRSAIYSDPENHPGCTLELNLSLRANDKLAFYCRFDPRLITLNEVQRVIARYKNSLINLDIWLQHQGKGTDGNMDTTALWSL
ncbi:non-ribosomal peptide synthetase [Gilliamella sp. App4-10]|uniref:non-ribosomal peptide synthetase n=1 Tax=Gilliamella sp. App4-10 TaxID=3120231 RepID=UPI00080E0BA4|nr:non-ribosomal peptide synthetase [Gilliamella apicola]OCG21787.1 non-ribosomal peptide synthetase [Gilliamella apicola]